MTKQRMMLVFLSIALALSGLGFVFVHFRHPYQLVVDGQTLRVQTIAFSFRGLLRQLHYELEPGDRTSIDPDAFTLSLPSQLSLQRARLVEIENSGEKITLQSAELVPANLLQEADVRLFPIDLVMQDSKVIDPYAPLPIGAEVSLQFLPAKQITLDVGGEPRVLFTQKDTLAEALLEAGIQLQPEDRLSASPNILL